VDIRRVPFDAAARPSHLARAREVRLREHLAGRFCAAEALRDAHAAEIGVGVGADGAPCWPAGFVGSITHTASFACAAVARAGRLRSLGIDSEPLLTQDALREITPLLLVDGEEAWLRGDDRLAMATLVFSAKESLYKCLRPLAGVFFELTDARVEGPDGPGGRWRIRLLRDLPGFPRGLALSGRHHVAGGMVHTAVELPSVMEAGT
jgi:enterobactin synthetase component D